MPYILELPEEQPGRYQLEMPPEAPEAPQPKPGLLDRLGRQLGLTGRNAIEGAAETAGILYDPAAYTINQVAGTEIPTLASQGQAAADAMGLPSPENSVEGAVGDASKFLVGTGGIIKGVGQAAKGATGATKEVLETIASRPDLQAVSAAGAGLAGGYAREENAGPWEQFLASSVGGIAAPSAVSKTQGMVGSLRNALTQRSPEQIETIIRRSGVDLSQLPKEVANTIRRDVGEAFSLSENLSPEAIQRLADYRATGLTPTRARVSQDPAMITQEENLSKLGANSQDPQAQLLAQNRNANNARMIGRIDELGAENAVDRGEAGEKLIQSLRNYEQVMDRVRGNLYKDARDSQGRPVEMDRAFFTNRADELLKEGNLQAFLPNEWGDMLNRIASNSQKMRGGQGDVDVPFTVDQWDSMKSLLASEIRSSSGSKKAALVAVRKALDETGPQMIGANAADTAAGRETMQRFDKARRVHAKWMKVVESTPALKAVVDGNVSTDDFVRKHVINAKPEELTNLRRVLGNSPEAKEIMRGQMAQYLKQSAIGNTDPGVANFRASGFNNALERVGRQRLEVFFTKDEINQLRALGRVASYEMSQPAGSAVNNSNTAAAAFSMLDRIVNNSVIGEIPFGTTIISSGVKDPMTSFGAGRALDARRGLVGGQKPRQERFIPLGLAPAGAALSSE